MADSTGLYYIEYVLNIIVFSELCTYRRIEKKVCPHCHIEQTKLARHIATVHSKNRPFSCNLCGKTFVRKDHCQRHSQLKCVDPNIFTP